MLASSARPQKRRVTSSQRLDRFAGLCPQAGSMKKKPERKPDKISLAKETIVVLGSNTIVPACTTVGTSTTHSEASDCQ
jgi:hypothetical protein